jgi:transcriptional regulator with XRE-family HTH domain
MNIKPGTQDKPKRLLELRKLLEANGVSYTTFGDGIGIRRETVSRWLNGEEPPNPTRETIDAILAFCRRFDPSWTYERLFETEAA